MGLEPGHNPSTISAFGSKLFITSSSALLFGFLPISSLSLLSVAFGYFSKNINWSKISHKMRKPSWIFDTRLVSNAKEAKLFGIDVWSLGN